MVIDFTSTSSLQTTATRGKASDTAASASNNAKNSSVANSAAPSNLGDTVKLSDAAKALLRSEQQAQETPDVDSERVEKLKAAIDSGTYQVNSRNVAEGLMRFEKLFG